MRTFASLLVFFAISYTASSLSVTTDPLHEGLYDESITLKCQFTAPSGGGNQYVITWDFTSEAQGTTETILVKEGTGDETSYGQFAGRATISGSQGDMRITGLRVEDTGSFKCHVDFYVEKDEGSATTRLEVYRVGGEAFILEHFTGETVFVKPGEVTDFTCQVYRGRPRSRILWYLGNDEITGGSDTYTDNGDGTYDTTSNLRYTFVEEDHEKVLKCESDQSPEIEYLTEFDYIIINAKVENPDPDPVCCECAPVTLTHTTTIGSTTVTTTSTIQQDGDCSDRVAIG